MVLKFYLQTVKSYGYFVATIMHFENILELISKVSFFSFTSLQTIFLICQLTRNNFQKLLFVCEKMIIQVQILEKKLDTNMMLVFNHQHCNCLRHYSRPTLKIAQLSILTSGKLRNMIFEMRLAHQCCQIRCLLTILG